MTELAEENEGYHSVTAFCHQVSKVTNNLQD
jgi:hypothetical protein